MSIRHPAAALRPRKSPRQARAQATVEAIVEGAAQVFATLGYAATTTNKVAERAGVSIGSLYEYFPNKDALLVALVERHLAAGEAILKQTAAAAIPGNLRDAVRALVHAMVSFHHQDRALHRVLFEESPLPRSLRRRLQHIEQTITDLVAEFLRGQPEVSSRDPALAAAIVVQTVESLTHRLVVHGELDVSAERWVDEITILVTGYLTAPRKPRHTVDS